MEKCKGRGGAEADVAREVLNDESYRCAALAYLIIVGAEIVGVDALVPAVYAVS